MAIRTGMGMGEVRERMERLAEAYKGLLDQMEKGEMIAKLPWDDVRFQGLVVKRLAKIGPLYLAAEKLAVIREVFGSGK